MIFSLKKVHKFLYSFFHTFRFCPLPSVLLNTLMTPFRALICVQVFVRTPRSFNLKLQLRKIIYYSCYRSFFIHLNSSLHPIHQANALHMPQDSSMDVTRLRKHIQISVCMRKHIYKMPVVGNVSTR